MIDDRMEDGISEEEAVEGIGTVDQIYEQIMSDMPLVKLVKEKVKPKRKLKAWEIVLLTLGSPVWIPLGATIFSGSRIYLCRFGNSDVLCLCGYYRDVIKLTGKMLTGMKTAFVGKE